MAQSLTIRASIVTFKIFRIFGFTCFSIENEKLVTKFTDFLYLLCSILTGSGLIYLVLMYHDDLTVSKSHIVNAGNYVIYLVSLSTNIIIVLLVFYFRQDLWNMVLDFYEIECKFRSIGVFEDYTTLAIGRLLSLALMIALSVPLTIVSYQFHGSILNCGISLYSGLYFMLLIGTVISCVHGIIARVKFVGNVLQSMLPSSSNMIAVHELKEDPEKIGAMIEIFSILIRVNNVVNQCFGVPTMIEFGVLFFHTLLTNFIAIKNLSTDGYLDGSTVSGMMYSTYYHLFIVAIIYVCSQAKIEAQEALKLSNKILRRTKDPLMVEMLSSLNALIKRNPLKFSCGMFDFDWSLVFSVSNSLPVYGCSLNWLFHFSLLLQPLQTSSFFCNSITRPEIV